jgi:predicted metal-dependent enzyme (double-stranded beta helix superfamily)
VELAELCKNLISVASGDVDAVGRLRRVAVQRARTMVEEALSSRDLLAECISRELDRLRDTPAQYGLSPFHVDPVLGIRFAFGYWGPGQQAGAHEHTDWTVTAVCHNALEVLTYDREETYRARRLVPKRVYPAPAGKAGYICEPAIHNPRNHTSEWSLSLHVIGARDGQAAPDGRDLHGGVDQLEGVRKRAGGGPAHPFMRCLRERRSQQHLRLLAGVVTALRHDSAARQLEVISERGGLATRRVAGSALDALRRSRSAAGEGPATPGSPVGLPERLVLTAEGLELDVRALEDGVELLAFDPSGPFQVMKAGRRARPLLEACARHGRIDVRDFEGAFEPHELWRLLQGLESWGVFTSEFGPPPEPRAPAGPPDEVSTSPSAPARGATTPAVTAGERRAQILQFRAPYLVEKLVKERVVRSESEGEDLFDEVKRYLFMTCLPGARRWQMYSSRVDSAWHNFVLFTSEYFRFCQQSFGRYVHHRPSNAPARDSSDEGPAPTFRDFASYYEETFARPLPDVWFDHVWVRGDTRLVNEHVRRQRVRVDGSRAELMISEEEGHSAVLVRVNSWAAEALRFIASNDLFLPRELPGPLSDHERRDLCAVLVGRHALRLSL